MNIVVITGPYGKKMSPESSSIDKYIKVISSICNVYVVCPKANGNQDVTGDITIINVSNSWNSLRVLCEQNIEEGGYSLNLFISKLLLLALRIRGYMLSFFAFPTRNRWLIKAYSKGLERLEKDIKIDGIISMGGLPCAHFAALNYKRKHPEAKWVTYTFDPVTINDDSYEHILFKSHRKRRYHNMEKIFWETADWNLFTEELYHLMKEEFGDKRNNYICFPYVLSKPTIDYGHTTPHHDVLRAVYAGALYLNIRNPKRMLEVMSKVENVKTELYTSGECDGIIKEYEGGNIERKAMLPRPEYLKLIGEQTDILVNIANSITFMAPSKFFELLSTGLPIINFYTVKNTNYYMTEKYPIGINIGPEDADAVTKVQEFCNKVKKKRLSYKEVSALFPENNMEIQVQVLKKCLGL